MDTQRAVVGGVGADDGAVAEPDLTCAADDGGDDLAVPGDRIRHRRANRGEETGFAFDAGCPGVAVGGADNAPLPRLGVGEDEFGEGLGAGAGFAGAAAAEPQHDPPIPAGQHLIGPGHRTPRRGHVPGDSSPSTQGRDFEFPQFTEPCELYLSERRRRHPAGSCPFRV